MAHEHGTAEGTAATSRWDPRLVETMTAHGNAVMEERLIPLLLNDLTS